MIADGNNSIMRAGRLLPLGMGVDEGVFSPASLFANGEAGGWYDPSDMSTLFQDAAGTTPVTASGQPVGLMLDKSKGLVLGSELTPAASGWIGSANWSVNPETSTATLTGSANSGDVLTLGTVTGDYIGQLFQVTITVESVAGSVLVSSSRVSAPSSFTAPGIYTYFVRVTVAGASSFNINTLTGTTCVVSNISIRKLSGNHAGQPDAAKRPLYQSAGGLSWLKSDLIDDSLPATVPSLDTNATVWYATEGVTTILTGQTIGAGAFETLRGEKTYTVGAIDRALTGPETASLTAYLDATRGA